MTTDVGTPEAVFIGVGIGDYDHYPPLPAAPTEVREVAELLESRGVSTTIVATMTEEGLRRELKSALRKRTDKDDTQLHAVGEGRLVVLWAGHGDKPPDAPLRLVAKDTAKDDPPELTPDYVAQVAVRSGATQILLIFDTCFSGGGTISALATADRWHGEQEGPPGKVWLGVLSSAMDWEKARDDLFGNRLVRLLRDGPSRPELRPRWSPHNAGIRGDDLIDALQKEWTEDAPHWPKAAQYGNPWTLLPNPLHDPAAPPRVVEHLLHAARGAEPEDDTWYFSGRQAVVGRLVSWIDSGEPGLRVVTGPAGCGKSAVLGLVVCLSIAEQREALLEQRPLDYQDPGVGSVNAHVYARGLAHLQLVRELDSQLSDAGILPLDRRGLRGGGELVDAVAASGRRPVMVIDGLDEAGVEAWPITEELLRPMARHALILVGTRDLQPPDDGPTLVTRLQPADSHVVHLLEEVDDAADVHEYVLRRVRDVDPAMAPDQIADAIQALPAHDDEGRFLLARVITAQLRADPVDTSHSGWQQQLARSVAEAFDRDLNRLPPLTRGETQLPDAGFDLLAALAWAQGGGLPDDIWPLVAAAISLGNTDYGRDDAYWALTHAGRYIVEAGEAGHAVYRLSHQHLAQHLRARTASLGIDDAELRIATGLVDRYRDLLNTGVDPTDHPYLWRYTWRHCADAGPLGMETLRDLVDLDRAAFLPDLALASQYLTSRYAEAGTPLLATEPAEDAVSIYRELAENDPALRPDLAIALDSLAVQYRDVGRRVDAIDPGETAVELFRALSAQASAYISYLASSLNNLAIHYAGTSGPTDAIEPAEASVGLYREMAIDNPAFLPDLAMSLNNLGNHYAEAGRQAEAVQASEAAVALRRKLAADNAAFLPELAGSLDNLAARYREVGAVEDALALTAEAVNLYRGLVGTSPAALPDLAMSLDNLGTCYSRISRPAEAVTPTEESVDLFRRLARDNPAIVPHLATALNNLGVRYIGIGRGVDAVGPTEESVGLFRQLAAENPAFLPDLAMALDNLGARYGGVGRHDDAIACAEEAVNLRRDLAVDKPALLPDLAAAVSNLGARYGEVGRLGDAIASAEEAVALYRELVTAAPTSLPDLAMSLNNLSIHYAAAGRLDDAVASSEEAVGLFRELAATGAAVQANFAMSLANLTFRYSEAGRWDAAVASSEEVVGLYRELAVTDATFHARLAEALGDLAVRHGEAGQLDAGVASSEEAVEMFRQLAETAPAFNAELAQALSDLGVFYGAVGRSADAVPPTEEAVTIYRELADADPAFRAALAGALNNLGNHCGVVGRSADAVDLAEEAVTIYRELVDADPAFRAALGQALMNLGNHCGVVGRSADAVDLAEEAVTIYRELAADSSALLPDLAMALTNLGEYRQQAGMSWDAEAVWTDALDRMPTSDLKAGLLLEKSRYSSADQAIGDVLTAIAITPSPSGPILFDLHSASRRLRHDNSDLFDQQWQHRFATQQPPWLHISDDTLTTVNEWLHTSTHTQARDYHREYAGRLAQPDAQIALDELALLGADPDLIDQYRLILTAATERAIDQAYHELVLAETLSGWINADPADQLQLLADNRDLLLSEDAAALLDQWSAARPDDIAITFGKALLILAREGVESELLTAVSKPDRLDTLLANLRATNRTHLLLAATELLLGLNLDNHTAASTHLHRSVALVLTGDTDQATAHAQTAARLEPGSVNRWIADLAQLAPAYPELASLIQTLATVPPNQPGDSTTTGPTSALADPASDTETHN